MFGIDEISVSKPPMLVKIPSVKRNGTALSCNFRHETMVSEPTMIIAVPLFRNALNTTVNPEKQIIRRNGSPRDTFKIFTATHVNNPQREINSTKIVDPMIIPIVPQSIIPI